MSLIKRYIDIDFGVDARPLKRVPGTIVQGNNKVNVLRITYPNISSDHVVVALTQRADQVTGSTFLDYSVNSGSFELVLHNWFTAVSGELQITFAIYSQTPEINEEGIITTETDTLRKVYLNVEESISADLPAPEDESIFLDVAVMVKTYDARIEKLETYFITDLNALDNFTTPGVYKINFNNNNVFHLFVIRIADSLIEQTRSSKQGYYIRTIYNSIPNEWIYSKYNIDGKSDYDSTISYKKGAIVNYFGDLYLSLIDDNNTPLTVAWKKLDFASFVNRFELSGFVPKEEGKGLSSNDLTNELLAKLNSLKNYDDTAINNKITVIEKILVSDNVNLDTLQEIVDMLESNEGDINAIFTAIAKKVDKDGLKTINGESIVGSGNIVIKGGDGGNNDIIDLGITDYIIYGNDENSVNGLLYLIDLACWRYQQSSNYFKGMCDGGCETFTLMVDWQCGFATYCSASEEINFDFTPSSDEQALNGSITITSCKSEYSNTENYLKNNDNKPDDYFSATYKEFSLYSAHGYMRAGEYSTTLSHQDDNGYSSVYMGSGRMDILADNDVYINNKSFNKLYDQVQDIYGEKINYIYDNDVKHTKIVPENVQKYASINKLGGMTNLIDDSIQENKVTAIKINNKNLLRGKIFYTSGNTYTKEIDEEGWITLNFDATSSSSSGTNITLVATQSTPMINKGELATARIIFKDGINNNIGSIVFGQGSTSGDSTTRFTSLGYNANEMYSYRSYTGIANYNIDQVYIWLAHSYVTKVENVKFKVELIKGNGEPIYLLPIPEEIQNLEGYGLSIPNTEINNEIDFDIDKLKVSCKKYIFTGTENLTQASTSSKTYRYWFDINDIKTASASNILGKARLTGMDIKTADQVYLANTGFSIESSGKRICIYHPDYQTADSMKEFLKDKTLIYELSDTVYKSLPVYLDNIILVEYGQEIEFVNDNNEAVCSTIEYMEEN